MVELSSKLPILLEVVTPDGVDKSIHYFPAPDDMKPELLARYTDYIESRYNGNAPMLVTVKETCRLIGFKKTKTFALLREGKLERRKYGRATRVTMRSIRRFVATTNA
ncbi:hypothetical protein GRI58_13480 [Porphyrobacter algicida]|uniref:DNA-binding protein n=1 Tax=Qipengyuania algicida TaxID=1836209 RepID=A0A845AHU2_9SPHN|nr:helix-turn-helix domain-containing protein [Qipengyuania algicida]MXP29820.1 hypothetical protein [Qipengyuania algicida]